MVVKESRTYLSNGYRGISATREALKRLYGDELPERGAIRVDFRRLSNRGL